MDYNTANAKACTKIKLKCRLHLKLNKSEWLLIELLHQAFNLHMHPKSVENNHSLIPFNYA